MAKLAEVRPDAVVLDLEDGVGADGLDAARARVEKLLAGQGGPLPGFVALRTHAADHRDFADDVRAIGPELDALILPKVASASDVETASGALRDAGSEAAGVIPLIESAAGLLRLEEILRHEAVLGVAFGGEDFAADVGLPPGLRVEQETQSASDPRFESVAAARLTVLDSARSRIVTVAAAVGLRCRVDTPLIQVRPPALAEAAARRSRSMGFSGKFAIHPSHVEHVHAGFRPDAEEVAWARRVLNVNGGAGAASVGDLMVDEAVLRQARAVIDSYDA